MFRRKDAEIQEEKLLAPYAMKNHASKGRRVHEAPPEFRTAYQRDRGRIVHAAAFRRLEYKTQVFVNHEGDYYRTRLTHTLEVAQIARTIARILYLNEDLVETLAFAHDIGHPPFGHAGEHALAAMMRKTTKEGFDHNLQGLRVVDILEERYPDFDGLNLSYEVREGFMKHKAKYDDKTLHTLGFDKHEAPSLEAQVVNIADEIAYDAHDMDDGLKSALFTEADLAAHSTLWHDISQTITAQHTTLSDSKKRAMTIREFIHSQVNGLLENSAQSIRKKAFEDIAAVRRNGHNTIAFTPDMTKKRKALKTFLHKHMYRHYRVLRMATKARHIITALFQIYHENPEQLPPQKQEKVAQWGAARTICDYIAEMTDRYCLDEYRRFFDPHMSV